MASSDQMIDGKKVTAAYAPFKSFLTSLDYLKQGMPDRLDVSVWPTFSGGLSAQLLATYRFLGLVDSDNSVLECLAKLVDESTRKQALKEVVMAAYPAIFQMDLSRTTPNQLAEVLRTNYNVSGATFEKAQTFFLQSAKFAGIALSPAISRKTRKSPKRRNGFSQPEPSIFESQPQAEPKSALPKGSVKTIHLKSGGTATLMFDVDVFAMTDQDQAFVFDLIKKMREYESSAKTETPVSAGTAVRA